MDKIRIKNTLDLYLDEVFRVATDKKLIIMGCKRVSLYFYCAIAAKGREISYFVDPEWDEQESARRTFMNIPACPLYRLIYEDPDKIAVINSLHYRSKTDEILRKYGLEENKNFFNLHGYQSAKESDVFDPMLGYARNEDIGSFHIYGTEEDDALRIVTVGGATTDYCYSNINSWPYYLHKLLDEKGIKNVVFNGAVNGYTSCEERDVVLRDVPCLKPDIVLSLSGECDIGYIMTSAEYPWYSRYSVGKFDSILRAHKRDDMTLWFDELRNHSDWCPGRSDSRNWLDNQKIMYASLKSQNIKFLGFLQPFIFEGDYEMSPFEEKCMELFLDKCAREIPSIERIFIDGKRFYKEVKDQIKNVNYLFDLTDSFDRVSGVYSDGVHYDEEGNRLIAQRIVDILSETGSVK